MATRTVAVLAATLVACTGYVRPDDTPVDAGPNRTELAVLYESYPSGTPLGFLANASAVYTLDGGRLESTSIGRVGDLPWAFWLHKLPDGLQPQMLSVQDADGGRVPVSITNEGWMGWTAMPWWEWRGRWSAPFIPCSEPTWHPLDGGAMTTVACAVSVGYGGGVQAFQAQVNGLEGTAREGVVIGGAVHGGATGYVHFSAATDPLNGPLPFAVHRDFNGDRALLAGEPSGWTDEQFSLVEVGRTPFIIAQLLFWRESGATYLVGEDGYGAWIFIPWPATVDADGMVRHVAMEGPRIRIATLTAADMTGDGTDEIIVAAGDAFDRDGLGLAVLSASTTEGIRRMELERWETCPEPPRHLASDRRASAADLDGDGLADAVLQTQGTCGMVAWGSQTEPLPTVTIHDPFVTRLESFTAVPPNNGKPGYILAAGALARDDLGPLPLAVLPPAIRAWRVTPDRQLVPEPWVAHSVQFTSSPYPPVPVDVDGDGELDLFGTYGPHVALWRSRLDDGGYRPAVNWKPVTWPAGPTWYYDAGPVMPDAAW